MSQGFDYLDVGGGINSGSSPAGVETRQMIELANYYPYHTRLRRRGGARRVTTVDGNPQITAMFPYKTSAGAWSLIVGQLTGFGKLTGSFIGALTLGSGVVIASSAMPWVFFQYKDFLYAMRRTTGTMLRLDGTTAQLAGLAAPATAMTISDGGAGNLTAGTYRAVFTNYNTPTAIESNPSMVSNALALGANRKINYNGVTVSSNPFVDDRRIYRTLENQVGVYFFMDNLGDNNTTVYNGDNVVVADLGRTVSFNNGVPPAALESGVVWNERLFAHNGKDLFFSEFLLAECFGDESLFPVFPDDGHKIRALHAFGDRLVVGKTNKVHYLVGDTAANFGLHTLSDVHGCMAHHSMKSAEGTLFWYASGKKVCRSDGTSVRDISTPRIKEILKLVPDTGEENICATVFQELNWYVIVVPQAEGGNNTKVLVYNYKFDTWTVFDGHVPQFIGEFFTANYGHILYSTKYDGHIYLYNDETYGYDDAAAGVSNPINAVFRTKPDDFGAAGFRKSFEQFWLLTAQVPGGSMLLETFRDDVVTPVVSRSVSLNIADSAWKAYDVSGYGSPGTKISLRGTYSGAPSIDIDAMHFEIGMLQRRPGQPR